MYFRLCMSYVGSTCFVGSTGKINDDYYINNLITENHKYLLELIETLDEDSFTTILSLEKKSFYVTSYSSYLFDYLSNQEGYIVLIKNRLLLPELLKITTARHSRKLP